MEQLYPFPEDILKDILKPYTQVKEWIWCQEEPLNQGPWFSSMHHFNHCIPDEHRITLCSREASAAPAAGSMALHLEQQQQLVSEALQGL